jgi:hypothetical protein
VITVALTALLVVVAGLLVHGLVLVRRDGRIRPGPGAPPLSHVRRRFHPRPFDFDRDA